MTHQEILTDDYLAELLAKDAKESSIRYSALGLDAFTKPSKPPANKPKPNTRFLRNIIKDTDSHNAALLAKEAAESKARLENLSSNEYREVKASRIGGGDIRRRQLGDIASILGGRPTKRKRPEESKKESKESRRVNTTSEDEEPIVRVHDDETRSRRQLGDIAAILGGRSNKRKRTEGKTAEKRSRRANTSSGDEGHDDRTRSRHRNFEVRDDGRKSKGFRDRDEPDEERRSRKDDRKRRRSVSGGREDEDRRRWRRETSEERRKDRWRSRSPKEHRDTDSRRRDRLPKHERSKSPQPDKKRSYRSDRHRRSPSVDKKPAKKEVSKLDYDSDPLDDIIGPRPALSLQVRSRGRGAISHGSGMDSRFSASYDPAVDVQLDLDEENDWDQALEALRDRQKWKQQGADRLRAAGFTDEEIKKWENNGEKTEEDVKWSKRGESREWDRGKVVDEDGAISLEPTWGRLKDS